MSMVQGVTQPVTPDTPLAAHPLAGEHNKTAAVFADLLNEISMQTNAKTFAGIDIDGIATLSNGAELPSEYSDSNNSPDVSEVSGAETDRNSDAGGIPTSLEVAATGTQLILAAYAQPGRMPVVDSLPSHEVDSVQNANPVTTGRQTDRVETAPIIPTSDKPALQTDEQSYSFATEKAEHQLQQQTKASAATDQATQPTPQTTAKKAAPEFVQSQIAATPVMENFAKPEAAQQLPGRMPVANSPASQQTARVETAPISTPDKPVLQTGKQSYGFATVGPERQLQQQTIVSAATTQATQPTPQMTANAVVPEAVQPQTKSAPEMEVAARVTTTQQLPGRMPVVNSPPSHEVDSARKNAVTTVAAELPHALSAAQVSAQPVSEQAVRPVPTSQQTGQLETAPISTPDKPVLQTAEQTESLSIVLPKLQSFHRSTTAPPEPEAEIEFSLPRPIVVSKAHSTESSRMLQTTTILRPQIISLDMDQPQNSPAEFGTVSASKLETLSPPTTHRQENGRTPEATLTLSPEIGLTQKVRPEVAMTETTAETLVKPAEETSQLNSIAGIKSAPMQQAIRRVTVQVERDTNSENARPGFSQAVAKENATPQQNAVPAGEASLTSDDSMGNSGDQTWSGQRSDIQVAPNQVHAQSKFEHQSAGTVPNARINAEQTRQDLPEQVAHQVRERLIQHEVKPGNQQITLTLSPENMGELKMNLNLQGQRLSVEIVAESRTVRDAILQHSDSLKDSLSRQNITVESFDVTSNGRGSGNPAQSQDSWRELARQKQQSWTSSGGYRLPQMDASPNMLAYQAKNEHAMLDIHY